MRSPTVNAWSLAATGLVLVGKSGVNEPVIPAAQVWADANGLTFTQSSRWSIGPPAPVLRHGLVRPRW